MTAPDFEYTPATTWITQDGQVTDKRHERGVWPTPEAAAEMMQRCLSPNEKADRLDEAKPRSRPE